MKARSSMNRNFTTVCLCAGLGDIGYTNRWTLEITNHSRYYTIPLVVDRRVAQIVFFRTGELESNSYTDKGKYQSQSLQSSIESDWKPEDMLPKMYLDKEIKHEEEISKSIENIKEKKGEDNTKNVLDYGDFYNVCNYD